MLNSKYKISVIVPAYNIEEHLPRCLDSIINQTHKNLEIIVISDGSTDGTNEIIKDYCEKDKRIIAIFKDNSGVSDTRNKGLDIATGDYIGFVDGDDYIEPAMYEVLLKNAIENDADISHCGYQMVFPSRIDYYYNTGKKVVQDNKKGVLDIIVGDYIEPGIWNKLYKREILDNVRMPKDIRINEDVVFNVEAFMNASKSYYEDKTFYHYILRKNSASTSKYNYNKLFDSIKVCELIIEKCNDYDKDIKNAALARYAGAIMRAYKTIRYNRLKEYYKEIRLYRLKLSKICGRDFNTRFRVEKFLVRYIPWLYILIYGIYDRLISKNKNKYEVK